ncbi:hypothetical protein [Streptomyces xantholiticus]|uniref:Uncharacterized protein n=1 Tax=Streptomyces xantholiticus TaxID=68285 RepID=A0ABV1V485_9ACTN
MFSTTGVMMTSPALTQPSSQAAQDTGAVMDERDGEPHGDQVVAVLVQADEVVVLDVQAPPAHPSVSACSERARTRAPSAKSTASTV